MLCPNCKKENADNFRYCQFCGSPISASLVMKAKELDADILPPSAVSAPASLDAWLADNDIEKASLSMPAHNAPLSEISLSPLDERQMLKETGRKRISTEDLPLLDESNATFIPVDVLVSPSTTETTEGVRKTAKRFCAQCGATIQDGHRFCGSCGAKYDENGDSSADSNRDNQEISGPRRSVERLSFVKSRSYDSDGLAKTATWVLFHINDDGTLGERIPLNDGENIIGHSSSRLLSSDRYVSPKHLRLNCSESGVLVEDNDSLNGVFYRLSDDSTDLFDGDIFRIGEELLCLSMGNSSQALLSNRTAETTELLGGEESDGWGYLRVIMGAYSEGSVFRLSQPSVSLGRTHANILFSKDGFVSGTHASLQPAGDHAILTDLNSSNGTFVRLKKPMTVPTSAYILIGNQLLLIKQTY
ncbi:MAG: FHA domain-containing protein [Proteobacteria bacterium]|nr:FHA domain-containing protein [Pseudomonadota bacterium]